MARKKRIKTPAALELGKDEWLKELTQLVGLPTPIGLMGELGRELSDSDTGVELAARESIPRQQSTVTLLNGTGSDLRLLRADLKFRTARFVPAAPAFIPAHDKIIFKVVELTVGADKTEGSARYHIEQRRHNVDVTFSWAFADGDVKFNGEGPFSKSVSAARDSDTGNEYELLVKEVGEDPLEVRIEITNNSGFGMKLVSANLEDPEHTEFKEKPKREIKNKLFSSFVAQPLDEEHPDAAGSVDYLIEQPNKPHLAHMTWRKSARPVGSVDPNDGAFIIKTRVKDERIFFDVEAHQGPPPQPPGPTRVTIINDTSLPMERDLLILDGKEAKFKSEPDQIIQGGRKTQFEVESTDPEFPQTDGIAAYALKNNPAPAPSEPVPESIVNMSWRSENPSFAKIVPPTEGVTVDVSGPNNDVVFTVTGAPLDFNPPAKIKQPTLRLGDKSKDGWVEYLQEALNLHLNAGLEVDGSFGAKTLKAVLAFQTKHKDEGVLVDGIVGDQTWSFLREGAPEPPHADGLPPHSFVEKGLEARWVREREICRFDPAQDALVMQAVSVGDVDRMEGRMVRIRIINPENVAKVLNRPLGPDIPESTTGQGNTHEVKVEQFSTLFDDKAANGPPPGNYTVDAFFDEELGGDKFSEVVVIAPR